MLKYGILHVSLYHCASLRLAACLSVCAGAACGEVREAVPRPGDAGSANTLPGVAAAASERGEAPAVSLGARPQARPAWLIRAAVPGPQAPMSMAGLPALSVVSRLVDIDIFAADARLCRATGGTWHGRLFACGCPASRIFAHGRGCVPTPAAGNSNSACAPRLADVAATDRPECARTLRLGDLQLALEWGALSPRYRTAFLQSSPEAWVAGATFSAADANSPFTHQAAAWSTAAALWGASDVFAPPDTPRPWDPAWAVRTPPKRPRAACAKALGAAAAQEGKALCRVLHAVLAAVVHDAPPRRTESRGVTLYAQPEAGSEQFVEALYRVGDVKAAYRVHARDGAALLRHVVVELNDRQLWAFVSAAGNLDGAELLDVQDGTRRGCFTGQWAQASCDT